MARASSCSRAALGGERHAERPLLGRDRPDPTSHVTLGLAPGIFAGERLRVRRLVPREPCRLHRCGANGDGLEPHMLGLADRHPLVVDSLRLDPPQLRQ